MDVWLSFAFISENKVKNIACFLYTGYTEANIGAKLTCNDENAFAVDVTHTPVQIGDDYIDGTFYREGRAIIPLPSVSSQVDEHNNAIDDLWVAILEE